MNELINISVNDDRCKGLTQVTEIDHIKNVFRTQIYFCYAASVIVVTPNRR